MSRRRGAADRPRPADSVRPAENGSPSASASLSPALTGEPSPTTPATEPGLEPESLIRRKVLDWLARFFLIAAVVAVFGLFFSAVNLARQPIQVSAEVTTGPGTPRPTRFAIAVPPTATPDIPLVALLAGHSGGADPGAICPDGLREVDVTTDVAQRAKTILQARGYRVDILAEFDPRLNATKRDYAPSAFLAIHADSCVKYASGYKVARATNSATPDEDDRLVRCVTNEYFASTQLPFHADSITTDMTHYHAFGEIDSKSPAAIVELGFLGSEHELLKNHRPTLAEGIANGIDDFMQGQSCKPNGKSGQ